MLTRTQESPKDSRKEKAGRADCGDSWKCAKVRGSVRPILKVLEQLHETVAKFLSKECFAPFAPAVLQEDENEAPTSSSTPSCSTTPA
jgi:hypothetical protein